MAETRDLDGLDDIENSADSLLVDYLDAADWESALSGLSRATTPGYLLVAAESTESAAIGFVHVIEVDGHAHLEQLSVQPDKGRQGVGRGLVQAAMTEAAARGYEKLTLRTFALVPWNAPFYATCGFSVSEPESRFQRQLVMTEERLGLGKFGRRVHLTARVSR